MSIHEVIHERRRALGLTQEQVADYLGVSTPAVNKWEKGITYPDITLLPTLARLLKTDLNTLLCFQETLTKQEITGFLEDTAKEIEKNGIDAGIEAAEKRIQEYPNCGALIEGIANLIQGSLIMSDLPGREREKYQPRITAWYERAMDCDDKAVKNRVGFMAVSQYLQSNECEKAQQILDQLPEFNELNKDIFQSDIFRKQGKLEEAAKLLQKNLLQHSNAVLGLLWRLVDIELESGKEKSAAEIAQKAKEFADALDMWGYCGLIGFQSIAVKTKNVQECLSVLNQMLKAAESPWALNKSPLYHYLYPESEANISIAAKILPPLLTMLETDSEYDFLTSDKEFQAMLEKYRKKIQDAGEATVH